MVNLCAEQKANLVDLKILRGGGAIKRLAHSIDLRVCA